MKNISRRVFIKGLAVAGVAAAASTVLAGCNTNMIPGTDNEGDADVVPTPSNTYTFKDGDNTLVVEAPKFEMNTFSATQAGKANVVLYMDLTNNLGETLTCAGAIPSTAVKGYALVLTARVWSKTNAISDVTFDTTSNVLGNGSGLANLALTSSHKTVSDEGSLEGALAYKSADKDWNKIVVTAKLYKAFADSQGTAQYYYSDVIDETTFTYTNN